MKKKKIVTDRYGKTIGYDEDYEKVMARIWEEHCMYDSTELHPAFITPYFKFLKKDSVFNIWVEEKPYILTIKNEFRRINDFNKNI